MHSTTEHPASSPATRVRRRLTLYLSGFDPQGPAHYHQLYVDGAKQQAAVSGYQCTVGPRRKAGPHVAWWNVRHQTSDPDSPATETRYEFLRWDDIVRQHWPRGRAALLRATAYASTQMWRNGVMWQTLRTSWPMFVAIALPGIAMALLAVLLAGLLTGAIALAQSGQPVWAAAAVLAGVPLLAGIGIVAERRSHMAWLMRSLACLVRQGRGQTPELDERLDHFAEHVCTQARSGAWDEIVVVGHSSGAMMAMIVTARALHRMAQGGDGEMPTQLALLTLGHCAPLLSEQPEAERFREESVRLATSPRLTWIDYGAPPDGCCFPLVRPTGAVQGPQIVRPNQPKLLNPRFAQVFSAAAYQQVRSDKFRCHFQYLMATELPGFYDYFAITSGPLTLADRHRDQPSIDNFRQFQILGGPRR